MSSKKSTKKASELKFITGDVTRADRKAQLRKPSVSFKYDDGGVALTGKAAKKEFAKELLEDFSKNVDLLSKSLNGLLDAAALFADPKNKKGVVVNGVTYKPKDLINWRSSYKAHLKDLKDVLKAALVYKPNTAPGVFQKPIKVGPGYVDFLLALADLVRYNDTSLGAEARAGRGPLANLARDGVIIPTLLIVLIWSYIYADPENRRFKPDGMSTVFVNVDPIIDALNKTKGKAAREIADTLRNYSNETLKTYSEVEFPDGFAPLLTTKIQALTSGYKLGEEVSQLQENNAKAAVQDLKQLNQDLKAAE